MDPFDEFEFKPLTEGLGFHKKKSETAPEKSEAKSKRPESLLRDKGFSLLEEEVTNNTLSQPLPRKSRHKIENFEEPSTSTTAVDDILKNLQKNRHFDMENTTAALKNTKTTEEYKPTNWSFSATFLDGMLILASSLLCMIIMLTVTRVDLVANLKNPDEAGMIYMATLALIMAVTFIYMVVNRAFLGCTPGEWAFDQRIGKPEQMTTLSYVPRLAARTLLVMITGYIVLPIVSLFTGKDAAGSITGVTLHKKA